MSSIVALDIETTGVDSQRDSIIEIGAVRFNQQRIEGEWNSLINPGKPIPRHITQLTGINNAMVSNSPYIGDVISDLEHFVSDLPILGHNVKFDLSFLKEQQLFHHNTALDTYDMAAVLLPNASRYNLGALAQALNIPAPTTHRALADAQITRNLYLRLYDLALNLPLDLLRELVRLSENVVWGADFLFRNAFNQVNQDRGNSPKPSTIASPIYTDPLPPEYEPLHPNDPLLPLDIEEITSMLEHGGAFAHHFPHFEHRLEQVELCRSIANTLSNNHHLLAEAGTGVGKSIAYLLPAAIWAMQNNLRVVISTNTLNLQDQLINKDIPDIRTLLGKNLRASILKGRNNYLCPRRLEALRRLGPETPDELRMLAKMLVWLQQTNTGDLSEITIIGPVERAIWNRISANDEGCTTTTCLERMGGICPFHRAKQAANQSHIVVVNHALLLADVATGNRVLPDYDYLIVDEAHHLESATTNALSFRVTQSDIDRALRELGNPKSGILGRTISLTKPYLEPGQKAQLDKLVQKTTDHAIRFQNYFKHFFNGISHFLQEQREGRSLGNYPQQVRILPSTRTLPAWEEIEIIWEDTQASLSPITDTLELIGRSLGNILDNGEEELSDLLSSLTNLYQRLKEFDENITRMVFDPNPDLIYWVQTKPQNFQITLEAAPLHIGKLMEAYLWHQKSSITLTSATLATVNNFEYIRSRLNAWDADEIALGSPYDFENSTLLYIPENVPEPHERAAYQKAIERGLISLCTATGGRALVLFTSYAQLQATSNAISAPLANNGIVVYEQGQGASPHALLESFRTTDKAVLLGTRAFWEGVDVPGEALSVLAIIRLPFSVPTNPITAARSETFENPFYEYSIPEAILTFRQGFGRLIRSHQDRGVVTIFDKRVLSKQYGQMFIDSLPHCTVETGSLEELPKSAVKWLSI